MRLEIRNGAVRNQRPDDSDIGEWYPDDTRMSLVDEDGHPISRGPLRISAEQAADWPARAGRTWDGRQWVESDPGAVLAARKRVLRDDIDVRAGAVRDEYITSTPGQEGVYLLKREQATAYVAAGRPVDTTAYPLVQARADAYNETPAQAATVILGRSDLWTNIGAQIERERERGKRLVAEAADETAAVDARDAAYAALDALRPQ